MTFIDDIQKAVLDLGREIGVLKDKLTQEIQIRKTSQDRISKLEKELKNRVEYTCVDTEKQN